MVEKKSFERIPRAKPGDEVLRRRVEPARGLRVVPNVPALFRFLKDTFTRTPFLPMLSALVALWLLFALGVYFVEHGAAGTEITSYGRALFCGVAGFSTAGISPVPITGAGQILCGIWMALGSLLFFGIIVATVTAYFQLPHRRPSTEIAATLQYNLERLEDLSLEELETLKESANGLIELRIEQLKERASRQEQSSAERRV
jgi:voltage-gated potassium channel